MEKDLGRVSALIIKGTAPADTQVLWGKPVIPDDLSVIILKRWEGTAWVNLRDEPHIRGAFYAIKKITSADSPYTVTATDQTILVDATDGAVEVNLPEAEDAYFDDGAGDTEGRHIIVIKIDDSGNGVNVNAGGEEKIDFPGETTYGITGQNGIIELQHHGTGYIIISASTPV